MSILLLFLLCRSSKSRSQAYNIFFPQKKSEVVVLISAILSFLDCLMGWRDRVVVGLGFYSWKSDIQRMIS